MQLQLIATSTTGLESIVAQELKDLGLSPRNSDFAVGRTLFEGGVSDLIKANLWCRCAGKILVQLAEFDVSNDFDVIFDAVKAIEWENWAPRNANFHVEGRSVRSKITSVPALQRTVKKAIVDRLCGVWGLTSLPETGPTYTVEISLLKDRATITLDSTGRGLHRRGYRLMNVVAPLRETLAAALVKLSVWRPGRPLIDPFCASGTIPIEAALIGRNIAPGLKRSFDAEGWPLIPRNLWDEAREEARAAIRPTLSEKIYGSDIDETSLKFARQHAVNAGVDEDVVFKRRDFRDLNDDREYGCVVCNPPYGERLGDVAQLRPLYESIPAVLSKLPTWSHYIITSWRDFEKRSAKKRLDVANSTTAASNAFIISFWARNRREISISPPRPTRILKTKKIARKSIPPSKAPRQTPIFPTRLKKLTSKRKSKRASKRPTSPPVPKISNVPQTRPLSPGSTLTPTASRRNLGVV